MCRVFEKIDEKKMTFFHGLYEEMAGGVKKGFTQLKKVSLHVFRLVCVCFCCWCVQESGLGVGWGVGWGVTQNMRRRVLILNAQVCF